MRARKGCVHESKSALPKCSQAKLSGYPDFEHVVNGAGIQLQDRLSIFEIGIWQSVFGGDRGVLSPRSGDKASQQLTSLKTKQCSSFTHTSMPVKRRLRRHCSARHLDSFTERTLYIIPLLNPHHQTNNITLLLTRQSCPQHSLSSSFYAPSSLLPSVTLKLVLPMTRLKPLIQAPLMSRGLTI